MIYLNNFVWSDHLLIITNALAIIAIIIIGIIVFSIEGWHKINNRDIVITSMLITLAIIFNGLVSSITIAGFIKIRFGDVVIFYLGYRCKYILGYSGAIISDLLRLMIFPTAGFHFGFTFNACLFSLAGAISSEFKTKQIYYFVIAFIIVYLLDSFVLNIIWLVALGYLPNNHTAIWAAYVERLIELVWALPAYGIFLLLLHKLDKLV